MTIRKRPVSVLQFPEEISGNGDRAFLREVKGCMNVDRPQVVLDLSQAPKLDKPRVHLLLCCLEEAIKRNGDVKLAGVSTDGAGFAELAAINRLFEIFDTSAEAVNSFHQLPSHAAPGAPEPCATAHPEGPAASSKPLETMVK